jgi:carbonic anhydrase/acetyltransferase-like protein (isoleucine patch superfamily)
MPIFGKTITMAIIISVRGITPIIGKECFLAENATIAGEVELGDYCSVWFNAVIRGDVNYIKIGNYTNIQDGAIIHGTYQKAPTEIGKNVTIAHRAVIHGCTLEDRVLVGIGAIIMDHAIVQTGSIIAAGAVVLEDTIVESGSIYAGIPARKVKEVDKKLSEKLDQITQNYLMYAKWY